MTDNPVDHDDVHNEAMTHATTIARHASELLNAVRGKRDYHAQALMLSDYAHLLAQHAAASNDNHLDLPNEAPTEPSAPSPTSESVDYEFYLMRPEQVAENYNADGSKTITGHCGGYATREDAVQAAKAGSTFPMLIGTLDENSNTRLVSAVVAAVELD